MSDYDGFGDVINGSSGIFGAEQAGLIPGLKAHDSVHVKPTREGVVFQLSCQGCGKATHLTVEWPELVALKYGVDPAIAFRGHPRIIPNPTSWRWRPEDQAWSPNIKCSGHSCYWIPLRIDFSEPEKYLKVARREGYINQRGEQLVSQIAAKAAGVAGQAVARR